MNVCEIYGKKIVVWHNSYTQKIKKVKRYLCKQKHIFPSYVINNINHDSYTKKNNRLANILFKQIQR
jgi:hypothetical protein